MDGEAMMWLMVAVSSLSVFGFLSALVLGPIGKAIGARLRPASGRDGPGRREAGELEARLLDLEERLDFTERLLGQVEQRALGPTTPTP